MPQTLDNPFPESLRIIVEKFIDESIESMNHRIHTHRIEIMTRLDCIQYTLLVYIATSINIFRIRRKTEINHICHFPRFLFPSDCIEDKERTIAI